MNDFVFSSPAITATYANGRYTVRREGKGDWLEFGAFGGNLYQSGQPEPVGSIYIDDGPGADSDPYWARRVYHTCECGNRLERSEINTFDTPSEAVEEAAFFFLS